MEGVLEENYRTKSQKRQFSWGGILLKSNGGLQRHIREL